MNHPADQYADHGPYGVPPPTPAAYPHPAGSGMGGGGAGAVGGAGGVGSQWGGPGRAPGPDWSGGGRAGRLYDANATSDERLYAMFEHLAYFCWAVGVPGIVVTLVLWLIKKNESPFIDDHGRESINMQISMVIYTIGAALAGLVTCGVLWFLCAAVPIVAVVFAILGAIAAHRGDYYRYPAVIRFL